MGNCQTGDALTGGWVGDLKGFFGQGIDGILGDIAVAIMGAAVELFANLGNIPTLARDETKPDGSVVNVGKTINDQIGLQINWLVVTIAVASMLVAAFRMALERKGQPGIQALQGLVRMVLTVGASWTVLGFLAAEADSYSNHLYDQGIRAQLKLIGQCNTDGLVAFMLIIIGLLLLLCGVVHIILMYIRLGVMTLLVGTLPLAAAASMSESGTGWWRKHIAWLVAWLAYKPVVGLIMYGGAVMIGATGGDSRHYKLAGCAILLMTGVALPALMRLVVPAMSALGSKDATGAGIGAMAGGAGAVASGAKKLGIGGGGGSSSGGSKKAASGSSSSGGGSGGSGSGRTSPGTGGGRALAGRVAKAAGRSAVSGMKAAPGAAVKTVEKSASVARSAHKHASNITNDAIS